MRHARCILITEYLIERLVCPTMIDFNRIPHVPCTQHGVILLWFTHLVFILWCGVDEGCMKLMPASHSAVRLVLHDLNVPADLVLRPVAFGAGNARLHPNEPFSEFCVRQIFYRHATVSFPRIMRQSLSILPWWPVCKYCPLKVPQCRRCHLGGILPADTESVGVGRRIVRVMLTLKPCTVPASEICTLPAAQGVRCFGQIRQKPPHIIIVARHLRAINALDELLDRWVRNVMEE